MANFTECFHVSVPDLDHRLTDNVDILYTTTAGFILIDVLTVVFNVVVVVAMVKQMLLDRSRQSFGPATNNCINKLLMVSLASSDTVLGLFLMPLCVIEVRNNGRWVIGPGWCKFRYVIDNFLCSVSSFHILSLALDRYLAICLPLKHRLLTIKTGYLLVALTWAVPALLIFSWTSQELDELNVCLQAHQLCGSFLFKPVFIVGFACIFFIPFIIVYVLYCLILRSIYTRMKQPKRRADTRNIKFSIQSSRFRVNQSISNRSSTPDIRQSEEEISTVSITQIQTISTASGSTSSTTNSGSNLTKNMKAYRTIGIVLVCFTVCWTPAWVLVLGFMTTNLSTPFWLTIFCNWFSYLNSTVNPLLYCFNRSVRKAVRSLFWCKRKV
ncbi:octopamine receptor beta-3R-like [Physella acuta]|uniref:octopamine receptor beta-3R-like n=1 Tax=Physella acuta TaxID=109671 RepID=UPI0027DE1A06|nr:octopamine receptor beta-3R-like [Physella acuta]